MKFLFSKEGLIKVGWGLLLLLQVLPARGDFFLKDGDRVVFLGDSITEQRLYTRYIENYVLTRFPHWRISFFNAGWGGDTALGGLARLERDVLSHHPTVVTIDFGMNDAGYGPFDPQRLERYRQGLRGIVRRLKEAQVRVVLFSPTPVDPDRRPQLREYNHTLKRFAEEARQIALQEGVTFIDFFEPFLQAQERMKAKYGPSFTVIPDAVHPSPPGQLWMAYLALKGMEAPSGVAGVRLDVPQLRVLEAWSGKIKRLRWTDKGLSFVQQIEVLPWPIPEDTTQGLEAFPFWEDLNLWRLQVTGLPEGEYEIKVNGKVIGSRTAEELSQGLNLAEIPALVALTPVKQIDFLTAVKGQVQFLRWRMIQLGTPEVIGKKAVLKSLDRWVEQIQKERDILRRPILLRWEIGRKAG